MPAKENLFPLKMLVISLGVLLLGGTAFLASAVLERSNGCVSQDFALPEGADLVSLTPEGRDISIVLKYPDKYEHLRVDGCTGAVRQRFTVVTGR